MTAHEEGRDAAARKESAWSNPYATGSNEARDWARGFMGKPPFCQTCKGRGYYLENFSDNHFTPCRCSASIGGARSVA